MTIKINEQIITKLNDLHLTISTCESMTGGAIASNLVICENASKSFLGSFVTYHQNTKIKFANVNVETIKEFGTISLQCAQEMAIGTKKKFNTDICVSVSGNASNINPIENKKTGITYICIVLLDEIYSYKFISNYSNKINIINECVAYVYSKLWDLIKNLKK